jgi:hypothetical protein
VTVPLAVIPVALWAAAVGILGILVALGAALLARRSGGDFEALIEATREPRLPSQWTAEDWAELERQVSGQ